jgi:hypothetical protein
MWSNFALAGAVLNRVVVTENLWHGETPREVVNALCFLGLGSRSNPVFDVQLNTRFSTIRRLERSFYCILLGTDGSK